MLKDSITWSFHEWAWELIMPGPQATLCRSIILFKIGLMTVPNFIELFTITK